MKKKTFRLEEATAAELLQIMKVHGFKTENKTIEYVIAQHLLIREMLKAESNQKMQAQNRLLLVNSFIKNYKEAFQNLRPLELE